ncbi:MAG: hypothetical protein FJ271_11880 [Planctomycetes bacterium]|nr:hypothetical protein [Planctomycetota bacterium]
MPWYVKEEKDELGGRRLLFHIDNDEDENGLTVNLYSTRNAARQTRSVAIRVAGILNATKDFKSWRKWANRGSFYVAVSGSRTRHPLVYVQRKPGATYADFELFVLGRTTQESQALAKRIASVLNWVEDTQDNPKLRGYTSEIRRGGY